MINFACSNCAEPLEAPESLAGRLLNCPKCQTPHIVPRPAEPAPSPAVTAHDAPDTGWPSMTWAAVLGTLMVIGGFSAGVNDETPSGNASGAVVFVGGWLLIFLGILIRIAGKILDRLEHK
jgi:hypothetical protein